MAVAIAATARRLLAPARRRALWSASWSADPEASAEPSPSTSLDKKKKPPPSSSQDRLGDVRDAVNERKLPPELRGRPNAVRYLPHDLISPLRTILLEITC
jgi:DnaJ family protein C protein 28